MIIKETMKFEVTWSSYFAWGVVVFSVVGTIAILSSMAWFDKKYRGIGQVDE
jgi:hypothetical protein